MTKILAFTREFYRIPVVITVDGVAIDPTSLTVEFAIVAADAVPQEADWKTGSWETIDTVTPNIYLARILVGDSTTDFELTKGQLYDAYMRISDNPERPARLTGQIQGT